MWGTNLRILGVVLGTIALYTLLANAIPQIESEVPEELSFTGEVSPEQLIEAGQELYDGAGGCTVCHGLGTRAPNLLVAEAGLGPIGARCAERVPGEDCKTYLHRSLVDPQAHVVEGFQPIMPDMSRTLSGAQIWSMVAYLQSQGGEVTVTAADLQVAAGGEEGAAAGAAGGGSAGPSATTDPMQLFQEMQCIACHKLGNEGQEVGPPFDGIGSRLSSEEIRAAILDPAASISPGYEQFAGVMPPNFGSRLTAAQLEALVGFLAERK
ncbi:MAG TPA: c-type cytochrome [Gemmatimonadota bacterium]|nr:c-type cytochrome [Gemmatimonadota bacterium]